MTVRRALPLTLLTATAAVVATLVAADPAAATTYDTQVPAGSRLVAGDVVRSGSTFTLTVQSDGNVVERRGATAVWATRTQGNPGAVLDVQTDGNVVVRASSGRALWTSRTAGISDAVLSLEPSGGELQLYGNGTTGYSAYWSNGVGVVPPRTVLRAGESLRSNSNDAHLYAPHQRYSFYAGLGLHISEYVTGFEAGTWHAGGAAGGAPGVLTLQTDGNLVYRDPRGAVLWAAGTRGAGLRLTMQDDGNLVLRNPAGAAVWSTRTGRNLLGSGEVAPAGTRFAIHASRNDAYPTSFLVQSDGNVVRFGGNGRPVWSTGTAGNPGARLVMQTDGNLVVRRPDGRAVWQSGTSGCGRSTFDAGYAEIYAGFRPVWSIDGGRTGAC